jgi:hypothetical protein
MRSILFALALAGCLGGLVSLDPQRSNMLFLAAPGALALGVLATSLVFGRVSWLTVTMGALSPLPLALIAGRHLEIAIALTALLWLSVRWTLAVSPRDLWINLVASAGSALVAGWIVALYVGEEPLFRLAACVFAGSALSLSTLAGRSDTPTASALVAAAAMVEGPVRAHLERAAAAERRRAATGSSAGDRTFEQLLDVADRRAALRDAEGHEAEKSRAELDSRITALVESLEGGPSARVEVVPVAESAPATEAAAEPKAG